MPLSRPAPAALLVALVLALTASHGLAEEVELVADIHPGPAPRGAGSERWIRAGSHL